MALRKLLELSRLLDFLNLEGLTAVRVPLKELSGGCRYAGDWLEAVARGHGARS
jgi:hypothetical protein